MFRVLVWFNTGSFVSEHIETLEEIDVEYRDLAYESGIKNWGRVPALGCEPRFIDDLADAVVEALPYVGKMASSSLEARQVRRLNPALNGITPDMERVMVGSLAMV